MRKNLSKNTFFPSTIIERNKLDPPIRNSISFSSLKESNQIIQTCSKQYFSVPKSKGNKIPPTTTGELQSHEGFKTTNSNTHFQTLLINFALVGWKQKQQIISYSTTPITKINTTFSLPAFAVAKADFGSK